AGEELTCLLRVARLRDRGEAHEIGEQHRDKPPLGRRRWMRCGCRLCLERGAALRAEAHSRFARCATGRADPVEPSAATAAEARAGGILRSADWTDVHRKSVDRCTRPF